MELFGPTGIEEIHVLVSTSPLVYRGESLVLLIWEDISELITLRNFLLICSHCKKIHTEEGLWDHLESYIASRSNTRFSHGVCPECAEKYYSDAALENDDVEDIIISIEEL